jgi:hypothetical protein
MANPVGTIFRPLWVSLDKFLSGGARGEPLYLSNRTTPQKLRSWLAIGVPCLVLAGFLAFGLTRRGGAKVVQPSEPTPAQVAAKMLPDYTKTLDLNAGRAVFVDEVEVEQSEPRKVIGVARNISDHEVVSADVVCELENRRGSRLGGVTVHVSDLAPHSTKRFQVEIAQATATFAIVREIDVH